MRPAQSSIVHFLSKVGVSVVGFLSTIYLTRMLGSEVYGTYVVVLSLVYWTMIPSNALSSAITKRVSEDTDPEAYLGAGFVVTAAVAVVVTVALVVFRQPVTRYVETNMLGLIVLVAAGRVLFPAVTGGLSGQRKVGRAGLLTFVEEFVRTGLQVALVFVGWGLTGALFGYGAATALVILLGFVFYDVTPTLPRRRHFEGLLSYAQYSWLGSIKTRVAGSAVDILLLKFFVGTSLIAVYQISWNLAALLVMVSGSIQAVLFPEVSQLAERREFEQIRDLLEESLVFSGLFAFPGLFGALLIGDRVLRIYGSEFAIGASVLVVLIVARTVSSFGSQFVGIINGVDRPDLAFRVNLVLIVSNIGLNLLLIPLIGWFGAAIATTVAAATTLVLGHYYLVDLVGTVRIPYGEFLRQGGASLVMVVAVLGVRRVVPAYSHYATVALVFVGAVVYSVTILVLSEHVREKTRAISPIRI